MIQGHLDRVLTRIREACSKGGRDPDEITLIGVTKYASISVVREAIDAGLKHVGENKVQDARSKFQALGPSLDRVTKHMIGHLQSNKVKACLDLFDLIQSVDSPHLANAIDSQAAKMSKDVDIFIQVNTAGEEQKFGVAPSGAMPLIEQITGLKHVRLRGMMTIAPLGVDKSVIRKCFSDLRQLRDQASKRFSGAPNVDFQYLSMGMTDDFEIALEEGSNMVRIGRAIFQP